MDFPNLAKQRQGSDGPGVHIESLTVRAFSLWHVLDQKKMSKDVANGSLVVVLAHFENIFISKSLCGTTFRIIEYFLVVDEKNCYILRF